MNDGRVVDIKIQGQSDIFFHVSDNFSVFSFNN